jgi:putative DNA methylase
MLGAFAGVVAGVPEWVAADHGDELYARTVASILGLAVGKLAMSNSTQARWYIDNRNGSTTVQAAFGKHALPMVWDFTEANPFGERVGNWTGMLDSLVGGLLALPPSAEPTKVLQRDARSPVESSPLGLLATDPPYFAQIGYADLSDYFYVWHRRALAHVHPDLYSTVATPKAVELIAAPYRHGGSKDVATAYFVRGFTDTFSKLKESNRPDLPVLVVYAHRQEESTAEAGTASTAWDSMLTAILHAGLSIVGTWPIWASSSTKQIGQGTNAVATYVVLVCRPAHADAPVADRQRFLAALRAELPRAIRQLQEGAISAVDLGQATIGPGMAVFSRFRQVIEPTGEPMTVRSALELISQVQGEALEQFVGDLDRETRWAMSWFRDHRFGDGPYDTAEKLFKTTNIHLEALVRAGIVRSRAGKVALLSRTELPDDWDPTRDRHRPVWELTQHLVKRLESGGDAAAAELLRPVRADADAVRELAYWLFSVCERSDPKEAQMYDALVTSWPEIMRRADADRPAEEARIF